MSKIPTMVVCGALSLPGFASGLGMLGWMSANFSMRTGFASLAVSAAIGAVVILVAPVNAHAGK